MKQLLFEPMLFGTTEELPSCPLLFVYGTNKPYMFHASRFADMVRAKNGGGNEVLALDCGHWITVEQPEQLAEASQAFLKKNRL